MLTVIVINTLSVLFAYLTKFKNYKYGLEISFLIISTFLAIRYNYGNDYKGYLDMFKSINSISALDLSYGTSEIEPGWKLLNRVFKPVGFFSMIIGITIFQCFAYYRLIHKYVPLNWQWFAVFIYTFSAGFMLTQVSMMRQAFAMSIFLFSIDFIFRKKVIHYVIFILIASLFHQSALLMLPLLLLGYANFKINKYGLLVFIAIYISTIYFQNFFSDKITLLTTTQFDKYEYYIGSKSEINSGIGVITQFVFLMTILFSEKKQSRDNSILFKLSALGFVFIPLSFIVALIGRIGMYLNIITIAVYPLVLVNIKNKIYRYTYTIILMIWTLYGFFEFFSSDVWKFSFNTYQTIFTAPYWQ